MRPATGHATGWLLNSTTVVTAGHCVLTRNKENERLILESAEIIGGFKGRKTDKAVDRRYGCRVVIPEEYWKSQVWQGDVALIKVSPEFPSSTKPFSCSDTPKSGTRRVGVVGYPTDKCDGERMYESYEVMALQPVGGLLKHNIDTYTGTVGTQIPNTYPLEKFSSSANQGSRQLRLSDSPH